MKLENLQNTLLGNLVEKDMSFMSPIGEQEKIGVIYHNKRYMVVKLLPNGEVDDTAYAYQIEMDFSKIRL